MRKCLEGLTVVLGAMMLVGGAAATAAGAGGEQNEMIRVELVTGETFVGTVADAEADPLILEHRLLGRLELPREQVRQVLVAVDEVDDPDAPEAPEVPDAQPEPQPEPLEEFENPWEFRARLGFSGRTGQTESVSVRVSASAERDSEDSRLFIEGIYTGERSDGSTSRNEFYGQAINEWKVPSTPWSFFIQGEFDHDQFEPWRNRLGGFGGATYKVLKEKPVTWKLLGGAGARWELGGERRLIPEALIGSDLAWTIDDRQELTWRSRVYPNLDHFGDVRLDNRVEWTFVLNNARTLDLNLGLHHKYDTRPGRGSKRSDLRYFGAIGLRF